MAGGASIPAMVLAAGFGIRLRPLTEFLPKPLIPVANRPLIEYTLMLLAEAGVRRVAINLHHLGELIQNTLGDGSDFGLEIQYSPEDPILGTGGGLVRMRSSLEGETFFLLNGDVLIGVDLQAVLRFHRERKAAATMVVRPHPPGAAYTSLEMDEQGWLVDFKGARRPARGRTRPVMFSGVHVIEPVVFDFLPAEGFSSINDLAYPAMVAKGLDVAAFLDKGPWFELGTPVAYLLANRDLLSGRVRFPQLDPLEGCSSDGVLLGKKVRLEPGVQLGPEVAVGDGCILGGGARVARSVLWAGEAVDPGANLDQVVLAGGQVVKA